MLSMEIGMSREQILNPCRVISDSEHHRRFHGVVEYLQVRAREEALFMAYSYRNFRVGCAVFAYHPTTLRLEERWQVFSAANFKPNRTWPKLCAERVALQAAFAEGYTRILGIVIAGDVQREDESGVLAPTLRPCGRCREWFRTATLLREDTRIVSIHIEEDEAMEEMTLAQLLAAYPVR